MKQSDLAQLKPIETIRVLLMIHGLTQKDAAKQLGISASALTRKIKGDIRFSADEIAALADMLDVSADVLLGREPLEVR